MPRGLTDWNLEWAESPQKWVETLMDSMADCTKVGRSQCAGGSEGFRSSMAVLCV